MSDTEMRVTFYRSHNDDWVDMYIDDHKVFGGHSLPPELAVKYIAKYHLRRIEKYISDCPITVYELENLPMGGMAYQEDFD